VTEGIINGKEIKDDFENLFKQGELYKIGLKLEEFLINETVKRDCLRNALAINYFEMSEIPHLLAQIPFHAYITTNYDTFIEDARMDIGKPLPKFYKNSLIKDIKVLLKQKPFILKPHGDITKDNPDPIVISDRATRNPVPHTISYPPNMQKIFS